MKALIIGILAVVIVGGGGYALVHKSPEKGTQASGSSQNSSPEQGTQASAQPDTSTNAAVAATITYSNNGFSPAKTTVIAGDTVAIKNDSSNALQFDSDPHPAHTDDEELNVGTVEPGKTVTFKVARKGTFGFHNHLNSGDTGTIIVQ